MRQIAKHSAVVQTMRMVIVALLIVFGIALSAHATSTATLTVAGAEAQREDQSWDVGPLLITIGEPNYSLVEAVYYGQYSTPMSVAAQISGAFTRDYMQNGLCATASVVNGAATVTFKLRGTATFGTLSVIGPTTSFQLLGSGFAAVNWAPPASTGSTFNSTVYMAGGVDHGTFYDTGTVSVRLSGAQVWADWGEGSTASSLASELAAGINTAASGFVNASPSGATISIASVTGGPAADTTISGSVTDTGTPYFSTPSFTVSTANMSGGGATEGNLLYSFAIPEQGGYDANGNMLSSTDSVMGQWNYGYDNLNRLVSGSAVTSTGQGIPNTFAGVLPSWNYDAFGNRTAETWSGSGTGTVPTSSTVAYAAVANQVSSSSMGTPTYDPAGDVTVDSLNSYLYDAEGRLCAVKNSTGAMTGYIYDASGIRVAKGSLAHFTCDFNPSDPYVASTNQGYNGYQTTTSWVLGPGGEQVTEYAVSGGTSTWVHTNAFAAGQLLATYHDTDTYFELNDWLGTKRAEAGAGGCFSSFTSMPFGDGLTTVSSSNPCQDATEHHFTSKERDSESGNDYFEARYYSGAMGRFMSPDWSAKVEPVPYAKVDDPQSLNLYTYLQNSPLGGVDTDGHVAPNRCGTGGQGCKHFTVQNQERLGNAIGIALGLAAVAPLAPEAAAVARLGWTAVAGWALSNAPQLQQTAVNLSEGISGAPPGGMGSSVWSLAPAARGLAIEARLGSNLPQNFPTIDKFTSGVATSIKSLDLNASSYQNAGTLASKVAGYIDKLAAFNGGKLGTTVIQAGQITSRELQLAVPGAGTAAQQAALQSAAAYAAKQNVRLTITQVH